MSKAIKQMQQVLDDIEDNNKCTSMNVDDKDRQHDETIEYATWKTNEPMLESERERLKNNLACGLSMLQPLELCAMFQVVSDAIRETKIKELKEITSAQPIVDQHGNKHIHIESENTLQPGDQIKVLMLNLIKEAELCISMLDNMYEVARMKHEKEHNVSINPKEVANA